MTNVIDDDWVDKYVEDEVAYDDFYNEIVKSVNVYCVYIDKHKNIIKIKKDRVYLDRELLSKNILKKYIDQNKVIFSKHFKLFSILKYNFNIDIKNIKTIRNSDYLTRLNSIEDIYWGKTAKLFSKLNSIHLLFSEKSSSNTKKIYIGHSKNHSKNRNKTKKVKFVELEENDGIVKLI